MRLLLQVSTLVCALPWVRELELDPLVVAPEGDAARRRARRGRPSPREACPATRTWRSIPYPVGAVEDVVLRDGTRLHGAPDPARGRGDRARFVQGLSEQSRYFRFFYRLHELSPAMLARFTQVDYDREMALVARRRRDATRRAAGASSASRGSSQNPDHESAEYRGRGRRRLARPRPRRGC